MIVIRLRIFEVKIPLISLLSFVLQTIRLCIEDAKPFSPVRDGPIDQLRWSSLGVSGVRMGLSLIFDFQKTKDETIWFLTELNKDAYNDIVLQTVRRPLCPLGVSGVLGRGKGWDLKEWSALLINGTEAMSFNIALVRFG